MREIKFRAWGKKDKKMYGIFDPYKDGSIMKQTGAPLHIAPLSYFIFLQYTGLKDVKGVEIFEGDIVITDSMTGVEIVGMEGGNWSPWLLTKWEVIGNKFENKDLLK